MLKIRPIKEKDWKSIVKLQQQAYTKIKPESETVLRKKHIISPSTCMVAEDNHKNIQGCCLAHPWASCTVPPLYQEIEKPAVTNNLFIHDMAVFLQFQKTGVASNLCKTIINLADKQNFKSISLVAVQDAGSFWMRFGFTKNANISLHQTYGEGAMFMELQLNG